MGIFDGFRKEKEAVPQADTGRKETDEFDNLLMELMGQDDIQDRSDICEHIYAHATKLLETPTSETVYRAYHLMGNLAAQFSYIPAMLWMGDFLENVQNKYERAAIWYKRAAEQGSGQGARNYADMLMAGKGMQANQREALKYYSFAMEKGIPEAAFVVGEFLRSAGDRNGARQAYQKAMNGGYAPAKVRLDQMK